MVDLARSAPARPVRRGNDRGPVREFLVFSLAGELYGVELTGIKEILSPPPITPVPRSGRDVVGVCSVRGLLVTVLDLRRRLRLEERPVGRRTRILLAMAQSGEVTGLLVDDVRQVVRLAESEIEIAAAALGGDVAEHVMDVGRPGGVFLVLLDLKAILKD
jgi:purine-binding chemotaxis protein CheW